MPLPNRTPEAPQVSLESQTMPARKPRSGEFLGVREDMTALLAHDLKTPLAAISMNLDFALGDLPAATSHAVRAALEDCRVANLRAVALVGEMADAARLASGDARPSIGDADPAPILERVAKRASGEAAPRGTRVAWSADTNSLPLDADLFERALDRIVERAMRHVRPGGSVDVDLRQGVVTVRVAPIASADSSGPHAAARSLAACFADAVMRAHGGSFCVESDSSGAMVFRLALAAQVTP